jgi:hypothetical protein
LFQVANNSPSQGKTIHSISDHLKDDLGSPRQIHHSDRIDHNPSIHPSLSNIVNSEASRTSNQENRNSNKKQNQQKMTTTTTTKPPYPTRASIHALFQNIKTGNSRRNLQASLSRRRLDSNGDASLRRAITLGTP